MPVFTNTALSTTCGYIIQRDSAGCIARLGEWHDAQSVIRNRGRGERFPWRSPLVNSHDPDIRGDDPVNKHNPLASLYPSQTGSTTQGRQGAEWVGG